MAFIHSCGGYHTILDKTNELGEHPFSFPSSFFGKARTEGPSLVPIFWSQQGVQRPCELSLVVISQIPIIHIPWLSIGTINSPRQSFAFHL